MILEESIITLEKNKLKFIKRATIIKVGSNFLGLTLELNPKIIFMAIHKRPKIKKMLAISLTIFHPSSTKVESSYIPESKEILAKTSNIFPPPANIQEEGV